MCHSDHAVIAPGLGLLASSFRRYLLSTPNRRTDGPTGHIKKLMKDMDWKQTICNKQPTIISMANLPLQFYLSPFRQTRICCYWSRTRDSVMSLCRSIRSSVTLLFFTERWYNFCYCPCPTYATDAVYLVRWLVSAHPVHGSHPAPILESHHEIGYLFLHGDFHPMHLTDPAVTNLADFQSSQL